MREAFELVGRVIPGITEAIIRGEGWVDIVAPHRRHCRADRCLADTGVTDQLNRHLLEFAGKSERTDEHDTEESNIREFLR